MLQKQHFSAGIDNFHKLHTYLKWIEQNETENNINLYA